MSRLIEPRTLKGFRDYLPELMIPRERLLETARRVYRSYGFAPIDTPALEYSEVLLGKGGDESDKLMYRFQDHGKRDVSLRFDLTVPFARFAAQHIGSLGTPFKRYQMGPVWRGENTFHGRYREFWQCDFDTIGTTANAADIEVALVIHDLLVALGFDRFQVRINNRLVLNGLLEELGLAGQAAPLLRALDKLPKIGRDKVREEMTNPVKSATRVVEENAATGEVRVHEETTTIAAVSPEQADQVLNLAEMKGSNVEILARLESDFGKNERAAEGIRRLRELITVAVESGVPEERLAIDLSIARGLDYYTGTIYETFLTDKPDIGSICSGGRYDNLAALYTKQTLPGVGASLGLDRLLAAMEELKLIGGAVSPAPVLFVQFAPGHLAAYEKMARALRGEGIGVEVYPEPRKMGAQFQYAEKRGFRIAVIARPDDLTNGVWNVLDLASKQETPTPTAEVAATIRRLLS